MDTRVAYDCHSMQHALIGELSRNRTRTLEVLRKGGRIGANGIGDGGVFKAHGPKGEVDRGQKR